MKEKDLSQIIKKPIEIYQTPEELGEVPAVDSLELIIAQKMAYMRFREKLIGFRRID